MAKLLNNDRHLKLYVVGHTDNKGGVDYNLKLSKQRAESVVKALNTRYGIQRSRLYSFGVGLFSPIASNQSEDGRAKNRRVELVRQ
jgi:outer membrane protein OmpA-like peptidoglycan-associated protein